MQSSTHLWSLAKNYWNLDWDVLSRPLHNPNLVPSDYHLFSFLQNSLNDKHFNDADDVKSHLIQFFAGKKSEILEDVKRSSTKTDNI